VTQERAASSPAGVERDLDLMFALVAALRALASDPDAAGDSARRYDFSIRWGTMVYGRLHRLAYHDGRGELAPPDRARYAELRAALVAALPLVEQLGVAHPGAVDERIADVG
jgi:hypothetical protein